MDMRRDLDRHLNHRQPRSVDARPACGLGLKILCPTPTSPCSLTECPGPVTSADGGTNE